MGWTFTEKVILVIKNEAPDVIPWAYVVNPNNKKQLNNAIEWGTAYRYGGKGKEPSVQPKIVKLDNKDFKMEIIDSAGSSSQGGRLSFWGCKITQGDLSVMIGVASDLLVELIRTSTFVNGVCQQPLMLCRNESGVGLFHEGTSIYESIKRNTETKKEFKASKTTKWEPGYYYKTVTKSDIYLGNMYLPFRVHSKWLGNSLELQFTKNMNQEVNAILPYKCDKNGDTISSYIDSMDRDIQAYMKNRTSDISFHDLIYKANMWSDKNLLSKLPSRIKGNEAFEVDANYADSMDALLNKAKHYICINITHRPDIVNYAHALFDNSFEIMFLSNKPRTYENITDDERLIFINTLNAIKQGQYGSRLKVKVTDENGNTIEIKNFDNEFLKLLFN